jgi:hypothetical protein
MNTKHYVEEKMMKNKRTYRPLATVCASLALVLLLGVGVYASNLGGFRSTVSVWLHGDVTEVSIEQVGEGQYEITYPDGTVRGTGGMAYENGQMRGVTMDEVIEEIRTAAEVDEDEDGRIWLYLRDHKIDITDQIAENGDWAQVKVKDGLLADYITVVWYGDGGCSVSTGHFGFDSPDELRQGSN